jgi:recombination protein RecA
MVNTVGSCESKHWHKKWIPIKKSLKLDKKQRALIVGSLLGDGTMRLGKNARNVNFKVEQGLAQKEYVMWKYQILKPFVFTEPKISHRFAGNGEKYEKSWWFRTIRHPLFTEIYKDFYKGNGYRTGKKVIPAWLKKELTPLALAVWIMDDGSFSRNRIDISTYSFTIAEIKTLQKYFKELFDIKMNYYRDRDKGYRMYSNQEETLKLIKIISPYIIPSMMYKIISQPRNDWIPALPKSGMKIASI